ncbi:cell division protein ZapA [Thorsellia anophelis DSM 18579]|uniref:Cell division protein ZapA n=1 Tax=Thorsellia anophelis DSM 18579 TaxID=1123402 RepID=A0A1I0A6B2_9GAMM|nr:cell division protein ZapA [Thorsellia anophelis]SES89650.1 cell division protein ZapA [Thorsellia anophelis DSM 18579]
MTTQRVDISVFGRSFRVNCPTEQKEALELAALDLDTRLTELKNRTGVSNVEQLVFIAALNVCHELAQERTKTADFAHTMEARIRVLQNTIEQALLQHTSIDSVEQITTPPSPLSSNPLPSQDLLSQPTEDSLSTDATYEEGE